MSFGKQRKASLATVLTFEYRIVCCEQEKDRSRGERERGNMAAGIISLAKGICTYTRYGLTWVGRYYCDKLY